jgi:hypothetical protein
MLNMTHLRHGTQLILCTLMGVPGVFLVILIRFQRSHGFIVTETDDLFAQLFTILGLIVIALSLLAILSKVLHRWVESKAASGRS